MKFSVASIFFVAHGIAAMPWASSKSKHSEYSNEDITLRIQVSQSPMHHAKGSAPKGRIHSGAFDVCLRACWFEEPTCPEGWYPTNQGTSEDPCWTCCKSPDDELQL